MKPGFSYPLLSATRRRLFFSRRLAFSVENCSQKTITSLRGHRQKDLRKLNIQPLVLSSLTAWLLFYIVGYFTFVPFHSFLTYLASYFTSHSLVSSPNVLKFCISYEYFLIADDLTSKQKQRDTVLLATRGRESVLCNIPFDQTILHRDTHWANKRLPLLFTIKRTISPIFLIRNEEFS